MEQGAQWFALLRSGAATAADRQQWQAWLAAAPAHRQAWAYVESLSQGFAAARAGGTPEQARHTLLQADRQVRQTRARRRWVAGLGAIAACTVAGWSAWRHPGTRGQLLALAADHRTATGEIRDLALPDRSRLWLDTASAVDLDFSAAQRRLVLLRGQVLVQTAADAAARPFLVDSAEGRMQALGTQFSVRQLDGRTLLSVYESAVRVSLSGAAPLTVPAGEAVLFDDRAMLERRSIARRPPAWAQRMLAVQDLTLRALAEELNRYYRGHIGVADEVAGLRVVGSFPLGDMEAAFKALEADQPVRITQPLPGWVRIQPR